MQLRRNNAAASRILYTPTKIGDPWASETMRIFIRILLGCCVGTFSQTSIATLLLYTKSTENVVFHIGITLSSSLVLIGLNWFSAQQRKRKTKSKDASHTSPNTQNGVRQQLRHADSISLCFAHSHQMYLQIFTYPTLSSILFAIEVLPPFSSICLGSSEIASTRSSAATVRTYNQG